MFSKIKIRNSIATKAALAAVAVCVASPAAMAAVVCNTVTTPLAIPADLSGVYINLVTGATGPDGSVTGWDVNMYGTGGPPINLYFFWPDAAQHGGVATGSVYNYLASGATIGPAQTYSAAAGGGGAVNYVNIRTTQTGGYVGVRFLNEATSVVNYGWLQMSTTAPTGFPATITSYCYQNDGTAITAGTTPVALQNFSVD